MKKFVLAVTMKFKHAKPSKTSALWLRYHKWSSDWAEFWMYHNSCCKLLVPSGTSSLFVHALAVKSKAEKLGSNCQRDPVLYSP